MVFAMTGISTELAHLKMMNLAAWHTSGGGPDRMSHGALKRDSFARRRYREIHCRIGRPSKRILVSQPGVVGEQCERKELFIPTLGPWNVRAQLRAKLGRQRGIRLLVL